MKRIFSLLIVSMFLVGCKSFPAQHKSILSKKYYKISDIRNAYSLSEKKVYVVADYEWSSSDKCWILKLFDNQFHDRVSLQEFYKEFIDKTKIRKVQKYDVQLRLHGKTRAAIFMMDLDNHVFNDDLSGRGLLYKSIVSNETKRILNTDILLDRLAIVVNGKRFNLRFFYSTSTYPKQINGEQIVVFYVKGTDFRFGKELDKACNKIAATKDKARAHRLAKKLIKGQYIITLSKVSIKLQPQIKLIKRNGFTF